MRYMEILRRSNNRNYRIFKRNHFITIISFFFIIFRKKCFPSNCLILDAIFFTIDLRFYLKLKH